MTPPAGWTSTTLGSLGRYLNGRGFKKVEWRDSGRPIIRIQNLTGSGAEFNYFQGKALEQHVARAGDLLVSWAATLGAYFWNGPEAVVNQHIFKVESFIDKRFHKYLLDSKLAELMSQAHGSGMVHITRPRFDNVPIWLPPLEEQRRIVAILEEHLSDIDSAVGLLSSARRRVGSLRQAMIDGVASGAILSPLGNSELAQGWEWRSPLELASEERGSIVIGPFGSDLKTSDYRDAGVPLVFVRNVRAANFSLDGAQFVGAEKAIALRKHEACLGDVLITKMGDPPGDASVYDNAEPGIITADVIRLRPSQHVDPVYLAAAINSGLVRRQVRAITSGVAQKKVSLARFKEFIRIPAPSLELQRKIAEIHLLNVSALARVEAQQAKATLRGALLRQTVLAAAFSGRLVGRSSDTDVIEQLAEQESA